jgi:hypothetical protein
MTVSVTEETQLGLQRYVDVGLRLRSTRETAAATGRAIGVIIEEFPSVAVRLAGISGEADSVYLTVVITLGTVEQVANCDGPAREAVALVHRLTHDLSAHEPSLTMIPDPDSLEALAAREVA